jgi:hypothetical protein
VKKEGAESLEISLLADNASSHRITYFKQKKGAEIVFITFGIRKTDFDTPPFGRPFLTDSGFDHIHVAQAPETQYQNLSRDEFREVVGPVCVGRRVFTYGSSLGAYAAIYFSDSIGAQAIAGSPILPAHPLARRYPRDKVPIHHRDLSNMQSHSAPVIFFDPKNRDDNAFVENCVLRGFPNSVIHPFEYSGHQTLKIIQDVGYLKRFVLAVVRNEPLSIEDAQVASRSSSIYFREKAKSLAGKGDLQGAIEQATKSLAVRAHYECVNILIRCHLKLGDSNTAQAVYREWWDKLGDSRILEPSSLNPQPLAKPIATSTALR